MPYKRNVAVDDLLKAFEAYEPELSFQPVIEEQGFKLSEKTLGRTVIVIISTACPSLCHTR